MATLELKDVTKTYGRSCAVDGVSFSVAEGSIVGLLGPNGAGKTTTINMILGILRQDGGTISIFGKDTRDARSEINEKTNFAAVYAHVPPNLSVRQNLAVFAHLYGIRDVNAKVASLLEEFDLKKFERSKAGVLSSGEMSRLSLAKAVINDPCLLLLDEPTASLDPSVSETVREKIRSYVARTRAAVLWTSHNMHEIESVCDSVIFLSHGKVLLQGDPKTLPAMHGKKDLEALFISVAREPLTYEAE